MGHSDRPKINFNNLQRAQINLSINALIRTVRSKNLDSPSGLWFCCCWWWRLLGLGQDWSENMKALAASIGEIDSYLGFFMKMGLKQMGFWSLMGCRISTSQAD
ncbi:hypothetical protein HS088_TW09G00145 [Tripterygium wilfordii]|uniref:Uncharacterized protein n=1 Tax=Tripterygium wilfordii TaxID=458696 RepID=A0A7J7D714_TRIWF|nr:hypothetical protein HS088_TW09G00145 [Tripterygium wilfordii]